MKLLAPLPAGRRMRLPLESHRRIAAAGQKAVTDGGESQMRR